MQMSLLSDLNSRNAGAPLSKQTSYSLVTPHTLTGYKDFFRQNSHIVNAFLQVKTEEMTQWERKWCVFEDNEVRYADSQDKPLSEFQRVSMDKVVNLTADQTAKEPTIKITTTESRLHLKLSSIDQMRDWLFCFQKCIALVLTHILDSKARTASFLQAQLEDRKIWTSELGYGHGNYQNAARRHSQTGGGSNRAYTMEDLGFRDGAPDRDIPFPASAWAEQRKEQQQQQQQANNASKLMAVSPAIPITMDRASYEDDYDRRDRVASSFKEDAEKYSPLEEMMFRASAHLNDLRGSDDDEDGAESASEADSDGEMMFEMDEAEEQKQLRSLDRARSISRSSDEGRIGGRKHGLRASSPNMASSSNANNSSSSGVSESARRSSQKPLRWRCGHCSKMGPRNKNEDRYVAQPSVPLDSIVDSVADDLKSLAISQRSDGRRMSIGSNKSEYGGGSDLGVGYFGVYDGHCGDQAAIFLEEVLMERICGHSHFWSNIERAITETCVTLDTEFIEICRRRRQYCGTTCIGAFVVGSSLVVFNIGDSMAVLGTGGGAREMSNSHKPGRPDESERVRNAGGWITEEKELYMARLHRMDLADPLVMDKAQNMNWVTIHRVCGELAVSRSIGDPDYKSFVPGAKVEAYFSWPENHDQIFFADLVIPDPECTKKEISPEDEFLILASDGLWDVISSEEVVQYARRGLAANKSPSEVAEELCDLSIRLGSSDNVTVVLVQFLHQ